MSVTYSDELASAFCEHVAQGKSLRKIAKLKGMPATTTVIRWLGENEAFRAQYARAKEAQMEHYADAIVEISDATSEDPQRSRLRVDARKWLMSKLAPKKYGDKVALEHSGEVKIDRVERVIVDPNAADTDC